MDTRVISKKGKKRVF